MADSPQPGNPLLTQLTAAVTSIVTIVGLFVLTGVVGRVQRNFPTLFAIAVGAVVVGSAFVALSPLLHGVVGNKHAWLPAWLTIIGSVLVPLGVILTVVVAVSSAHRSERPVVTAAYDPTATATRPFTGTVKVADLSSNARVLFVVDGLRKAADGTHWIPHTVYQAWLGPDSDGKLDHAITMAIPDVNRYEAIGVKADSGSLDQQFDDTPCSSYPLQVSLSDQAVRFNGVGPGCVIIELSKAPSQQRAG